MEDPHHRLGYYIQVNGKWVFLISPIFKFTLINIVVINKTLCILKKNKSPIQRKNQQLDLWRNNVLFGHLLKKSSP